MRNGYGSLQDTWGHCPRETFIEQQRDMCRCQQEHEIGYEEEDPVRSDKVTGCAAGRANEIDLLSVLADVNAQLYVQDDEHEDTVCTYKEMNVTILRRRRLYMEWLTIEYALPEHLR